MDAFQNHYPENVSHCFGCGSNNPHGHQIKTVWEGDETVTRFKPEPCHTSMPGVAITRPSPPCVACPGAARVRSTGPHASNRWPTTARARCSGRWR